MIPLFPCVDFVNFCSQLDRFRVKEDGFKNRYPAGENAHPHCDLSYRVIYPELDNTDYTRDQNRANRRENVALSNYQARVKVNGSFDAKVLLATEADCVDS